MDLEESSLFIDKFLTEILDNYLEGHNIDKKTYLFLKAFMFQQSECVTTNNYFNFVFDEKSLDKIL
tara:strand:- start:1146 stop:1343 length:198 start_codon:yes stop_codon:yes gene_type:complete